MRQPKSLPYSVSPDTDDLSEVASIDARAEEEARIAQHPAHPAPLRLLTDDEAPLTPEAIDRVAVVTLICEVRRLQDRVARLEKQVKDINYREAV